MMLCVAVPQDLSSAVHCPAWFLSPQICVGVLRMEVQGGDRENMLTLVGLLKPCRHSSYLLPPCRCADMGFQPPGGAGHPEPEQGFGYLLHQPGGGEGRCQPGHCQQSEQADG